MPRFSVILPTRNRHDLLPHAAKSVQAQTFTDWELIIYDNSDTPCGNRWSTDHRVIYWYGPADGVAHASQIALESAHGEIVVPLADDDVLPATCLERSNYLFGASDWLCGVTHIYQDGDPPTVVAVRGGDQASVDNTLAGSYWLGGAVHFRRELALELGGYPERFDGAADFSLYLSLCRHSQPVLTSHVMYLYRDWEGCDSRVRAENQQRMSHLIANG